MTDLATLRDQRTAVYRFYGAQGNLLYVGIAVDIPTRWSQHKRNSEWWPLHDHATVHWYPDRATAEEQERLAIRNEGAERNIRGYGKTPLQSIRADATLWRQFAEVAKLRGTNRSEVLRRFIKWYVGEPDAELPIRTEAL